MLVETHCIAAEHLNVFRHCQRLKNETGVCCVCRWSFSRPTGRNPRVTVSAHVTKVVVNFVSKLVLKD